MSTLMRMYGHLLYTTKGLEHTSHLTLAVMKTQEILIDWMTARVKWEVCSKPTSPSSVVRIHLYGRSVSSGLFAYQTLYLIGMWFYENQWANIIRYIHMLKRLEYSSNGDTYFTLNNEHGWEWPMLSIEETNTHTHSIVITEPRQVRFSIRFLQMFRLRFANATQVWLCTSTR